MDLQAYEPFWNRAKPLMQVKLEEVRLALEGKTDLTFSDIYQAGDEEFRLVLDMKRADGVVVLGMDFTLQDGAVNESDIENSVGVSLMVIGYSGLVLGGYAPNNYTPEAFTDDPEEMVFRIQHLDVEQLARFIVEDALTNATLQAELAKAS